MSDHDDRLARLEARVEELARRVDQLGTGTGTGTASPGLGGTGSGVSDFDVENDTNRFPPTSEFGRS